MKVLAQQVGKVGCGLIKHVAKISELVGLHHVMTLAMS